MTLDERLEALVMSTELLTRDIETLRATVEADTSSIQGLRAVHVDASLMRDLLTAVADLRATVEVDSNNIRDLRATVEVDSNNIRDLRATVEVDANNIRGTGAHRRDSRAPAYRTGRRHPLNVPRGTSTLALSS
jgi:archaellum component FlaC